jgi:CheY-like chemotaxis protein
MPDGGTLAIRVEACEAEGHAAVRLVVRDTGVGMSPEVVDRVFEPFFTTKPAGHGTGLGLPTALAIVRSHGGSLTVESTVGEGSAFTITLPTAAAVAPPTAREAGAVALPTGAGELVLVIDDEVVVREITRRVLERFGYRVLLADGGRSGLTTYAAHRGQIRLVLTDLMMPDADGRAVIASLRSGGESVPIIAVSGLPDLEGGSSALPGATAILPKPYTADELLQAVRDALASTA